jgi:hypothetical protein
LIGTVLSYLSNIYFNKKEIQFLFSCLLYCFNLKKFLFLYVPNRHDRAKAVDILVKDLKVFSTFNEELYKEITQLLTLENFRFVRLSYLINAYIS